MFTSQKETLNHSNWSTEQRIRCHCRSWSHRDQQPRHPSTPSLHAAPRLCRLLSANPRRLTPPDREGASLYKSSLRNKRRYHLSLSLFLPTPPPPPSTPRKLCYHGYARGWSLIGGVCCDAASRWCSPPDWLPFSVHIVLQRWARIGSPCLFSDCTSSSKLWTDNTAICVQ